MKKLIEVEEMYRGYEGEALEITYRIKGTDVGFLERPHKIHKNSELRREFGEFGEDEGLILFGEKQ